MTLRIGKNYESIYNFADLVKAIRDNYKNSAKNGVNVIQIYIGKISSTTTTPHQKTVLTEKEFADIRALLRKLNMDLYIHSSVSLNLSNPIGHRYIWALENLMYDINFGEKLGARGIVVHMGTEVLDRYNKTYANASANANANASVNEAFKNMVKSIEFILRTMNPKLRILLETSAGQKNRIATKLEDVAKLLSMFSAKYRNEIGICVDTCHIYSAGYDISTITGFKKYIAEFDKLIGIDRIKLIHLNDSKTPFNSRKDIHAELGKGTIFKGESGEETLHEIINFGVKHNIPFITEYTA